jgi:hypothetical protein
MANTSPEPTLEEMLADPIVQLVMGRDNIVADDVRRVVHQAREEHRLRAFLVRRRIGHLPDSSANGLVVGTARIEHLSGPARPNTVQKDFHGGSDGLLCFLLGWRWTKSEDNLQMKVVADHAHKVSGHALAIIGLNFPTPVRGFEHLREPDCGPTRPLVVERPHKIREAIGFCDGNSVDAYHGRRHVDGEKMPAKCRERLPQVVPLALVGDQGRKRLVCAFRDDSREEPLFVAELIVDISFRSTCAVDDRVDARGQVALFKKELGSRPKKGLPATFGPPCLCCYHNRLSFPFRIRLTGNACYHMRQR